MSKESFENIFSTPVDNPLVPRFPIRMRNTEIMTIMYETDVEHIRNILPEPLIPAGNQVLVHFYKMNDAQYFGQYHESAVQVPCQLPGTEVVGAFSPYLYLQSDGAVASGRETYGQPKKYGEVSLDVNGDLWVGRVKRNGLEVLVGTLPYKSDPSSLEEMSSIVDFSRNINLKVIPNVDGSLAIKQLTSRRFTNVVVHECWTGPGTVEIRPNAQAPVYKLPVRRFIKGFYWVVDFTLPFGEVVHDYLLHADETVMHGNMR